MNHITENTIPAEIESLKEYAGYLCYNCVPIDKPAVQMTLADLHENQPSWDTESMIRGLEHLDETAGAGNCLFDIYTPAEAADHPQKRDVKAFYLPGKAENGADPSEKPFIISCSGGAYTCVCSLVESFPTAAQLNEMGFNVFVITYRVLQPVLFPMPLDDLAAAVRFILKNKEAFGIKTDEYIVNGYSAGANLTCLWGTESKGWKKYGLPKPKALFPIYPVTNYEGMYTEGNDVFLKLMFGQNYKAEEVEAYDVIRAFTGEYPPCYLVHAKDDPVVPYRNSELLKTRLDQAGIPSCLELAEHGGHGFGDGSGTDANGWTQRAVEWLLSL